MIVELRLITCDKRENICDYIPNCVTQAALGDSLCTELYLALTSKHLTSHA